VYREAGATDVAVASPSGPSASVTGLSPATGYQFYVVARDAAGNASAPSPVVSVTTSGSGGGESCGVTYSVNEWGGGGFGGNVIIRNTGTVTVNGWTLQFTFPGNQQVINGWEAIWTQTSATVSVRNEAWNGTIAPGGSVSIGFNGSYTGSNPRPTAFTLNATACATT
jgi:beta-glucosidase